eukprot:Opistho-2@57831
MAAVARITRSLIGARQAILPAAASCRSVHNSTSSPAQAAASPNQRKLKVMSPAQVSLFDKDGFILLNDFWTAQEKKDLLKWTEDVASWPETPGKWMQYFEVKNGKRLLCRTENILPFHSGLEHLVRGKLTDACSDLFGEDAVIFKEKINFKLAGGGGFAPHQDAPAYVTFKQRMHITAMIAIDGANKENGCLDIVRGEHNKGHFPHTHPGGVLDESYTKRYEAEGRWEPVVTQPGDIMFFHSCAPHRSGPNTTSGPRRAYYITYNPKSDGTFREAYFADKREAFPPDAERIPGKDYSKGGEIYNLANPIPVKS